MTQLSAPLRAFADFMALDPDLLSAAAEAGTGEPPRDPSREEIEDWVTRLPDPQKTELLVRLVAGDDPHLPLELRNRCRLSQSPAGAEAMGTASPPRTAGELLDAAGGGPQNARGWPRSWKRQSGHVANARRRWPGKKRSTPCLRAVRCLGATSRLSLLPSGPMITTGRSRC